MELDYESLLNRAQELLKDDKDILEARKIFNALLTDHFQQEEHAFYLIAFISTCEMKLGNLGLAITLLKSAIELRPDYIEAISNLGFIYKQLGLREQARKEFQHLMPFVDDVEFGLSNKDRADYVTNLASSYVANGTPLEAIELSNKALALNEKNDGALWNRGMAYLEIGEYEKGFEDIDFCNRTLKYIGRSYHQNGTPFWDGTPGKSVVVFGEQGIGDELMFASMLPDIMKDCNVILDAHIRLKDIFHHSFPDLHVYGTREGRDVPWAQLEQIDSKISMASLGKFYRQKRADFPGTPYLKADPLLVAKYKEKLAALGPRKKVGISWQGGTVQNNKKARKIPMALLLPLLKCDVDFISLQYTQGIGKKVTEFEQTNGVCLNHWQDTLDDYDETAGLVCNLDLIISVPQSVIHLAGGLGTLCYQLCPKQAMWQMGPYGQDMPWYSCVENIWQKEGGDWGPVIEKAKEKLCSLLQTNTDN